MSAHRAGSSFFRKATVGPNRLGFAAIVTRETSARSAVMTATDKSEFPLTDFTNL